MKIIASLLFLVCMPFLSVFSNPSPPDSVKTDTGKTKADDFYPCFSNDITMNPAFTGFTECENLFIRAEIDKPMADFGWLYRPQKYLFTNDFSVGKKRNNGIGISFSEKKGGTNNIETGGLSYARCLKLPIGKSTSFYHKLRIGISLEYVKGSIDFKKTTWGDQIDPSYGFVYQAMETLPGDLNMGYSNINAGVWYNNPVFYLGFSVLNIPEPDFSLYALSKIPRNYILSAGGKYSLNNVFTLHPSFIADMIGGYKGKFNSYNPALMAAYKEKIFVGCSYKDFNKINIILGATLFRCLMLNAECGYGVKNNLSYYGSPVYIGGSIRILNNVIIKTP